MNMTMDQPFCLTEVSKAPPCSIFARLKSAYSSRMCSNPNIPILVFSSWLIGIIAAVYVVSGGLKACAWADLIQGSALILGGAIVTCLVFCELGDTPVDKLTTTATVGNLADDAGGVTKFFTLNEDRLHMKLPWDDQILPWTALLLGIWIPNFYYWGLNQYIMQRTLGARSLADGQRGVVFAAGLKLIIPFIVCIPGIIAFSLYQDAMQENAQKKLNKETLVAFDQAQNKPGTTEKLFVFNKDFAEAYPKKSKDHSEDLQNCQIGYYL